MKKLTQTMILIAAIAAAPAADQGGGILGGSSGGGQQQHSEKLQQLPEKVRESLLKEAGRHEARISDIDTSDKDGIRFYKVTFDNEERSWTAKILEQGVIVGIDHGDMTKWEDLPQPVRDQLLQEAKDGGMITEILATRRGGKRAYVAEIEKDGKAQDVFIGTDGKKLPEQMGGSSGGGAQQDEKAMRKSQKEIEEAQRDLDKAREKAVKDVEKAGEKSERELQEMKDR